MKITILAVDDDAGPRDFYATSIARMGYDCLLASSGDEALQILAERPIDLMVTDLRMPGINGIDLLEQAIVLRPELLSIVITAYGTVDNAVAAMKLGARDFLGKPLSIDDLEIVIERSVEYIKLRQENSRMKIDLADRYHDLVGKSSCMKELYELIESTATARSTVLITGESGTGKELVARAIHAASDRKNEVFIRVNCAALPKDLVESELFGYEKGAFTGADRQKKGHFEVAHNSTLLLDEISEIPVGMQAKLLRVLQEKEITRLGSTIPMNVDVRVIATSNRNLKDAIANGDFREDLYYRLNVIPVEILPLRDRLDDLPLLINHFIEKCNLDNNRAVERIDEAALKAFMLYHWPGNVRELSNLIESAVVITKNPVLTVSDFPSDLIYGKFGDDLTRLDSGMTLAEGEKILILKTLKRFNGNKTKAAEKLQITPRTIRNKLAEYQIQEVAD